MAKVVMLFTVIYPHKIKICILGMLLIAISACGGGGGGSDSGTSSGGGGGSVDTTSPTVGAAISFSGISDTTITASWGAATDAVTTQANLQYRLVYAAASTAIDTIGKVDAAGGGVTVAKDYTAGLITQDITGLTALTTYYFSVVVRDQAGNKTLYAPQSQATAATGTVASPVFTPTPATYGNIPAYPNWQTSTATSGAVMCFTTNGTTPVCNGSKSGCTTGTLYASVQVVNTTTTFKALACKLGYTDSSVTSGVYTIDTTAPTIVSTTPADGATAVATNTMIAVTFSKAMDPTTIIALNSGTSCLSGSPTLLFSTDINFGTCIPMTSATPTTGDNKTFTMTPSATLATGTTYYTRVLTSVKDPVQNALAAQYSSATGFTTDLAPAITIQSI
ncbi:MAG: Ig-like domain-containing protein, partial [Spirochaetes bacterium]|nr:Ig-like domain-containing protein [Spirochaetota bacterium]